MPPFANFDYLELGFVSVGHVVNLNILANDSLGVPPATITSHDYSQLACPGLSFESSTGLISGTIVETTSCSFDYTIENAAGTASAEVGILAFVSPS